MCNSIQICKERWRIAKALASGQLIHKNHIDTEPADFGINVTVECNQRCHQEQVQHSHATFNLDDMRVLDAATTGTECCKADYSSNSNCPSPTSLSSMRSTSPTSSLKSRKSESELTEKGNKRLFLTHTYRDRANEDHGSSVEEAISKLPQLKGGIMTPFPLKLHSMLEAVEKEGLDDIVSWRPHGRAFVVHDRQRFVLEIMPRFFGPHKCAGPHKYSSFRRQLNLYGFTRLTRKGPDHGCYYHELFIRFRAVLSTLMKPVRIKGTAIRPTSTPESEPDFETMPSLVESSDDMTEATLPNSSSDSSLSNDSMVEDNDLVVPLPWPEQSESVDDDIVITTLEYQQTQWCSNLQSQPPSDDDLFDFLSDAGLFA